MVDPRIKAEIYILFPLPSSLYFNSMTASLITQMYMLCILSVLSVLIQYKYKVQTWFGNVHNWFFDRTLLNKITGLLIFNYFLLLPPSITSSSSLLIPSSEDYYTETSSHFGHIIWDALGQKIFNTTNHVMYSEYNSDFSWSLTCLALLKIQPQDAKPAGART